MRLGSRVSLPSAQALIGLVLAAVLGGALLLFLPRGQTACAGPGCAPLSTSATGWVLPRLGGSGTVSLSEFRGSPVVASFFASWCTACHDELPQFVALARELPQVHFVGIDSEEYGDGLSLARSTGITAWPLASDVDGSDRDGLHQSLTAEPGLPITAIYDSSGHLRSVRVGAETGDELHATLQQLFGLR